MHLIDRKLKKNLGRYIFQSFLATVTIFIVLIFIDVVNHPAILASLGATFFIVFTIPQSFTAQPRALIGGYIIGIAVGIMFWHISHIPAFAGCFVTQRGCDTVFGAIAVGFAVFFMVITDTEHPPAAGLTLGLLINKWDWFTISFLIGIVIALALFTRILKPHIIDLR